jgi:hypothetical protein
MSIFSNQTKYTLVSPIRVDDLGIESGTFEYIKPSNVKGSFEATVDAENNQITYDVTAGDLDELGTWSIWATYTDGNGRFTRARTTKHLFEDDKR